MESETEIQFRNDNLQRCFDLFQGMRSKVEFCDITFEIGSRAITAHRVILAASIPYFRSSFFSAEKDVTIATIEPRIFECFVDYAYSHEMKINEINVRDLLSGACHFGVEEVKEACCDFLSGRLQSENVISIRNLARRLRCLNLLEDINLYIRENFIAVSQTKGFLDTSFLYIREVISRDDLLVSNEEKIFEAVMKWIKASPENRKANLPELLRRVRLPLLKFEYLTDTVGEEELIRTSIPCRDLLDEAKNYHLFPKRRQNTVSFSLEPRCFAKQTDTSQTAQNTLIYSLTMFTTYTVQRFQDSGKEWKTIFSGTGDINGCCCATLNNEIYCFFGGRSLRYVAKKNEFRDMKRMLSPRSFAGAVSLKNKIIVCGGSIEERALNTVEAFDPQKDEWRSWRPMRLQRAGPCAVTLGDFIYVLGGTDYSIVYDSVERYNSETGGWRVVSRMLTKRCIASAATVKGKIYVCGGDSSPTSGVLECIATAEVHDPNENTWCFISPMKTARCEVTALSYRGKLYALGGFDNRRKCLSAVEIYDPESDKWDMGIASKNTDSFLSSAVVM